AAAACGSPPWSSVPLPSRSPPGTTVTTAPAASAPVAPPAIATTATRQSTPPAPPRSAAPWATNATPIEASNMPDLDPEDEKLVILARSTRARIQAAEGAAVRDTDGRTYAAATIDLPSLKLTAVQAAVAAAVSSGAEGLEAAAIVTAEPFVPEASMQAVRDMADDAPVLRADPAGEVQETVR